MRKAQKTPKDNGLLARGFTNCLQKRCLQEKLLEVIDCLMWLTLQEIVFCQAMENVEELTQ